MIIAKEVLFEFIDKGLSQQGIADALLTTKGRVSAALDSHV